MRARQCAGGDLPHQQARVLVTFFNADRAPVGQARLGSWQGTFDWSQKSGQLAVPPEARTAMIAVGLLGATGELACDDLEIPGAAPQRAARR